LQEGLEEDRLGREREATLTDVWKVLNTIGTTLASSSPKGTSGPGQQREYKVITQKDKWFSGEFDPEKVEGVLNSYAKQGWVMKGVATASVPGFGGQRDEIVIIVLLISCRAQGVAGEVSGVLGHLVERSLQVVAFLPFVPCFLPVEALPIPVVHLQRMN
jgi:Domain of unknown function (DUF4177)